MRRCTRCGSDAGDAAICPKCGGTTELVDSAAPSPPDPSSAVQASVSRGWKQTAVFIVAALALAGGAAWLIHGSVGPAPSPGCESLCAYAEMPLVSQNADWQRQIDEGHCRCNAMQRKSAPPMEPINRPPPGH
ncbi:MAG: hypothetical protein JST54_14075 [Deltaproteobacteria bacterium]|nr:hypothetical protein [Deltaproteobacteria bacterium]